MNIKGMDKAAVLAALYKHAQTQGLGVLHYQLGDISLEEARDLLKTQTYFDYLKGRVLKVDLSRDELDERLYDRDNGPGAAAYALADLNKARVNDRT